MKNALTALMISLIGGSILMIVLSIFLFPFATIWAINTLFPQAALDYNFWNWLAVIALRLVFGATASFKIDAKNSARSHRNKY